MLGLDDELVLRFKNCLDITTRNVIKMMRKRTHIYKDKLYLVDEYGRELIAGQYLDCGRSFQCKRRM